MKGSKNIYKFFKSFVVKNKISQILKLILVFQLTFNTSLFYQAHAEAQDNGEKHRSSDLFRFAVRQGLDIPDVRLQAQKFDQFADDLENGELAKIDPEKYDSFRLTKQRIEIFDKEKSVNIQLGRESVGLPIISVTSLKVVYDEETKELIFEGYRGADDHGEGGQLVAKQYIPEMDIATMAQDKEMLSIIDNQGRLHVIDMGFVKEQGFKSPIPVLTDFWVPTEKMDLSGKKLKASYLTRGLKPFSLDQEKLNSVLPRDKDGYIRLRAGDLIVTIENQKGQDDELFGVFSRSVTYEHIVFASTVLEWIAFISNPDVNTNENLKSIIKDLEDMGSQEEAHRLQKANSYSEVRNALLGVKKEQLQFLSRRKVDIKGGFEVNGLKSRNFDTFSVEEWLDQFEQIQNQARHEQEVLKSQIKKSKNIVKLQELEVKLKNLENESEKGSFAGSWKELVQKQEAEKDINQQDFTPKVGKTVKVKQALLRMKKLMLQPASVLIGGFSAYVAYPFAYESSELLQQVQALTWLYDHAVTDVMKDEAYRYINNQSMLYITALWPLGILTSIFAGKFIQVITAGFKNSSSKVAQVFRDLRKKWVDLTPWQRIGSFGMRFYGTIIYPLWNVLIRNGFRQTTFLEAIRTGLNPFRKVKEDSVIGKMAGLKRDSSVGTNNPLGGLWGKNSKKAFEEERIQKLRLQSAVHQQKAKVDNLAWLLAILVVSEKESIDPALIAAVGSDMVSPENIENIFTDKEKTDEFILLLSTLSKQLNDLQYKSADLDVTELNKEKMQTMLDLAYANAKAIKAKSKLEVKTGILNNWIRYKSGRFKNWVLNWGVTEHEFLMKVFTNKFVSNQIERHFVPDHLMVAGIYALVGERADLMQPDQLAADPNGFLKTNGVHWADVSLNTYSHFFASGSSLALVYQRLHSEAENNYEALEDFIFPTKERTEGFLRSTGLWVKNVSNPLKADLGALMWKRFQRYVATSQAALIMWMATRLVFTDQPVGDMLLAFVIFRFAANWVFGYPWDIVDRGTQLQENREEEMNLALKDARFKLSQGLKEENPERAKELLDTGVDEMFGLFRKYNPKVLEEAENQVRGIKQINQLFTNAKNTKVTEEAKHYYSTIVSLSIAITEQNEQEIKLYSDILKQIMIDDQNLDLDELNKLNAQSLLEFSVENTPIYTNANSWTAWFASWVGGAVLTTWLSIPLAVNTFNPEWITGTNLIAWSLGSLGLYGAAYATLGKEPWEYYLGKLWPNIKRKLGIKSKPTTETNSKMNLNQKTQNEGEKSPCNSVLDKEER